MILHPKIKAMLAECAASWPRHEGDFNALMLTLTPREGALIRRLYGIGCERQTQKAFAADFSITSTRVRQVQEKAFRKIAHSSRVELTARLMNACGVGAVTDG